MLIQIIFLIIIFFILSRVVLRFKNKEITLKELIGWILFWLMVAVAVIWPKNTDVLAKIVGVSRGADLLVYLSIVVIFFIIFKIIVKLEKIDKDITKIVREVALYGQQKKDQ